QNSRGRAEPIKDAQEQDTLGPAAGVPVGAANAGRDIVLFVAPDEPVRRRVDSDRSCPCLAVNPANFSITMARIACSPVYFVSPLPRLRKGPGLTAAKSAISG